MAIVVALGERPGGGYSIQVDQLTDRAGTLVVDAREIRPGNQELITAAITQPFIAVATPAFAGTVELATWVTQRT